MNTEEMKTIEEQMMVHLTNFYPNNKTIVSPYDGNKYYKKNKYGEDLTIDYKGVKKKVTTLDHRHTVHFKINSVVENTGDGRGNWDDKKMAIIEPVGSHIDEFVNFAIGCDSYTDESVHLSDQAILVIKRDALDLIPESDKEKWNIVISDDENIATTVKQILSEMHKFSESIDDAGHFNSFEFNLEQDLDSRDMAINYIKNNTYDGKASLSLTIDELKELLDIEMQNDQEGNIDIRNFDSCYEAFQIMFPDNGLISKELMAKIIGNGLKYENGVITVKTDDEMFKFKNVKSLEDFNDIISQDNINELYNLYMNLLANEKQSTLSKQEKSILNYEKDYVKSISEKKENTPDEIEAFYRVKQELLNSSNEELSEGEKRIVNDLIKIDSIDSPEEGFNISFGNSKIRIKLSNNVYDTTSVEELQQMSQHLYDVLKNYPNVKNDMTSIDSELFFMKSNISDVNIIDMPQQEGESYNEYYMRVLEEINNVVNLIQGRNLDNQEENQGISR